MPPGDCDTGLHAGFIGVIDGTTKTNRIRSDQANHMTVEVVNAPPTAGGSAITLPNGTVHARFRLANWGTQVWNPGSTDHGIWTDVPGGSDACFGPSGCTSTNVMFAAPSTSNIQFDWKPHRPRDVPVPGRTHDRHVQTRRRAPIRSPR